MLLKLENRAWKYPITSTELGVEAILPKLHNCYAVAEGQNR